MTEVRVNDDEDEEGEMRTLMHRQKAWEDNRLLKQ